MFKQLQTVGKAVTVCVSCVQVRTLAGRNKFRTPSVGCWKQASRRRDARVRTYHDTSRKNSAQSSGWVVSPMFAVSCPLNSVVCWRQVCFGKDHGSRFGGVSARARPAGLRLPARHPGWTQPGTGKIWAKWSSTENPPRHKKHTVNCCGGNVLYRTACALGYG